MHTKFNNLFTVTIQFHKTISISKYKQSTATKINSQPVEKAAIQIQLN
uniref:Uncharacterized protein n=1 Tax=Anguilla anguilla TaxID=7936 RepID=A0A0E9XKU2_ANGAN